MSTKYDFKVRVSGHEYVVVFTTFPKHTGHTTTKYGMITYSGETRVAMEIGNAILYGYSYCSTKDTFNELTGCKRALEDLLYHYEFTKIERRAFWQAFFLRAK